MADTKPIRKPKQKSSLIGNQAKPTVLDSTTKLDIDTSKVLIDNIIEAGLSSQLDIGALEKFTSVSNARDQVYTLIDTMCQDAAVSAIVRTYTADVCSPDDNGHIVWCESQNPDISKFVNYLLNVMNVDKNIDKWVYCLIKYGDVYLRLYRESDYVDKLFHKDNINHANHGRRLNEDVNLVIHSDDDQYSYYIEMVDDPSTMYELTKFGQTFGYIEVPNQPNPFDQTSYIGGTTGLMSAGGPGGVFNFQYKTNDVNVYQADDFVHAALEDNVSRFPETVDLFYEEPEETKSKRKAGSPSSTGSAGSNNYTVRRGKSLLYDAYKTWREKALLEAAALLSRITRSGIIRKVGVEVGDMPKDQVQLTLRRVKEMFEQKTAYIAGGSMSEYNNPGAVENFVYYATHNGIGAITVEAVGGDYDPKQLTDLDWWNNKFYSSFGIPKQYFGWTDDAAGFNGGTALTIISAVYANQVRRIQNDILQAITDIINLILLNKGCKAYLNNFMLKMKTPVTQDELNYRENFTNRVNAISNANSLFTDIENKARRLTILKNLVSGLHLGDEVIAEIQAEIDEAKETAKKEKEEAKNSGGGEGGGETGAGTGGSEPLPEISSEAEPTPEAGGEENLDLDLPPMPDSELSAEESFKPAPGTSPLHEDQLFEDEDDLPTPEEADADRDFTRNN